MLQTTTDMLALMETIMEATTATFEGPVIERVKVRVLPDGRMTRRDAARYLGIAVKTVAMWDLDNPAKLGGIKVGGRRFYFKDRLDAVIRGE